ncbi:MAG TPA: hypothetical protein VIG76_12300 [Amnibacterium sp.]|jgi:hypothetical protein|uniref:hypothetical protein n=1 Tax=Amnibacterium sp. TaxID=1872496 RepID=UPI002F957C87
MSDMIRTVPGALIGRAAFVWQFAAVVVLPLWVLTGYAIWGGGLGGFLSVTLLAPLLAVALLALAAIFTARATVRRRRMLGAADSAVIAVLTVVLTGFGFFGAATAWFGVLAVAALIGGFWLAGRELVTDVRTRMRQTLAAFGYASQPARTPIDAGEYVVIKPSDR